MTGQTLSDEWAVNGRRWVLLGDMLVCVIPNLLWVAEGDGKDSPKSQSSVPKSSNQSTQGRLTLSCILPTSQLLVAAPSSTPTFHTFTMCEMDSSSGAISKLYVCRDYGNTREGADGWYQAL